MVSKRYKRERDCTKYRPCWASSKALTSVLKIATCLGNRKFMSNILSVMVEKSVTEVAQDLWVALQQGFVPPRTDFHYLVICAKITRRIKAKTVRLSVNMIMQRALF